MSGNHIEPDPEGKPPRRRPTPFLVTAEWGYAPVGADGRPEIYDMKADPLATKDLSAEHQGTVEELRRLFLSHLKEHGVADNDLDFWQSAGSGEGSWAVDYPG